MPQMENRHAEQIAKLLNDRNQLTQEYTAGRVLHLADRFLYRLDDEGKVMGCVEVKRVQWYQFEILHLSVAKAFARTGKAAVLLADAERSAEDAGGRILQCTIREGNNASENFFAKHGYTKTTSFLNRASGNRVGVWQKVVPSAL